MGYESPMPVQEEVIPFLLGEDNDVIALAQTGTGKTAAPAKDQCLSISASSAYPLSDTRALPTDSGRFERLF